MSSPVVIELHIEELVLRGVGDLDRRVLQAAVEEELSRLLATKGAASADAAGSRASLRTGAIDLSSDDPQSLGRQLADALHASIAGLAMRGGA
jgi:hypothetical protein